MREASSLRLTFVLTADGYLLDEVIPHLSTAPFNKIKRRTNDTGGYWIQAEDKEGNILYWSSIFFEWGEPKDYISLLIPYNEAIDRITTSLPSGENGKSEICHFPLLWEALQEEWEDRRNLTAVSLPCDICGEGKGMVIRTVTVKYHGYTERLYNLVVLSDKYTSGELDNFRTRANRCIEHLFANPPFDTAIGNASMNVYFVEISTADSETSYFDVNYKEGSTHVEWSADNVKKVCDALFSDGNALPYWTWAGVLINETDQIIGTGWYSKHQFTCGNRYTEYVSYAATFRHEFSHIAFDLADEYSYEGDGKYTGGEPSRVNITINLDKNKIKWKSFLSDGVSLPTTGEDSDVVGAYEGANHFETGIYRPQYDCIMRHSNSKKNRYCKVCDNEAKLVVAKAFGVHAPAPGIMTYSKIEQKWNDVFVIFESSKALFGKELNKSDGLSLKSQLESGDVSRLVGSLFEEATKEKLDGRATLIECQSGGTVDYGVWYLCIDGSSKMYYYYLYSVAGKYKVIIGCISTPPYLPDSCFDGITTGQMLHAFCIDGYRLAYGQLELYSVNGISFVEQEVLGLSGNHNLTALSVANFNNSLIFVAVVDGGIIKIGAYELTSAAWSSEGFVAMPQEDGENYEKVKIAVSGRYVYVVAKGTDGLIGAMFDVFSRSWNKKKIQFADIAQDIYQFDISVYNRVMIITATTYNQANGGECGNVLVYFWNPDTVTVGNLGVNVAEQQVLETYNAAISSFGSAVIANELHCVMLKDTDAVDVVYDISYNGTSYQAVLKREDKIQQLNQNREIGSFVLHSDGNQIYLVLSGSTILKVSNSQE